MTGPSLEQVQALGRLVPIFPCRAEPLGRNKAKSPLTANGFHDASQEAEAIATWYQAHPGCLWGVPTGSRTRIVVIDYDPDKAAPETQEWIAEHTNELLAARTHTTARNGRHYIYRSSNGTLYTTGVNVALGGKKRPGLDIRGEGGYIIWWPLQGLHQQNQAPELPPALLAERAFHAPQAPRAPAPASPDAWQKDRALVSAALAYLDPQDYDRWYQTGMSLHHGSEGSDDGFDLWHTWSAGLITGDMPHSYSGIEICRQKWASFGKGNGSRPIRGLGSLFAEAKAAGWVRTQRHEAATAEVPRETSAQDDQRVDREDTAWIDPADDDPWVVPIDLWEEKPVPRLKPEWLPATLAEFTAEQSALTGTDPTVIGLSALVACAGVIDDAFRVQPKEHDTSWTESARLWGVIVGDPSSKKSPGIDKAIKPLRKIEAQLAAMHKDDVRHYEEALAQWTHRKGADKGLPPEKPQSLRVMVNDTTTESLSDVLAANPRGVMVYRDELAGWFGSMDAYSKSGNSKDRAFWLEAYNGGEKRIDRVMRGHIMVPNCSVSLLGGIQPTVFANKIRTLEEDGLLQRFMVVIASAADEDVDRLPNMSVITAYASLIDDLYNMKPHDSEREIFKLSEESQVLRRTFMAVIRNMLKNRAAPDTMLGYLGKWEGLFARLLCVYHCVEHIGKGQYPPSVISENTTLRVWAFMEQLLLPHATEFYQNVIGKNQRQEFARWIAGYVLSRGLTRFGTRDITQGCHPYRDLVDDSVRRGVWAILQDTGWVRPCPTARVNKQYGIPTQWDVNPDVHVAFKARAKIERETREARKQAIAATVASITNAR